MRALRHMGVQAAGLTRGTRCAIRATLGVVAATITHHPAAAEDRYELSASDVSPPGDRHFVAPSATVSGQRVFAAKLTTTYAYAPLLARVDRSGREHELVGSRLSFDLGASFALRRRILLFAGVPVVAHQGRGPGGTNALALDAAGLADARLGARVNFASAGPLDLAAELRAWLPTGSGEAMASDGTPRGSLSGVVSGRTSRLSFAASLGFLARERSALEGAELGPAFPFTLAAAFHPAPRLQVGAELWGAPIAGGARGFFSDRETPLFALFGVRLRAGSWVFGGAAGPGLSEAPGVAPRMVLSVAYEPEARPPRLLRNQPAALPPDRRPHPAAKASRATLAEAQAPPRTTPLPGAAEVQPVEEAYPATPPPPARAPKDEHALRVEAREAFTRGVAAYDEARYEDAVAEFSRAYGLLPHISVLRNLAHSELMSGRMKAACEHFIRWKSEVQNPTPLDVKQANEGMRRACR